MKTCIVFNTLLILSILILNPTDLFAADRTDTNVAAKMIAGAFVFGGIALFNAIKKKKK